MRCAVCGTKMNSATGGNYHCPTCGHAINDLVFRSSNSDIPMPQSFGEEKGWICPVCGRGLAPWVSFCPCQTSEIKITYETNTNVIPELERLFKLNDERVSEMISFYEEYGK